jgi:hypothetical protein
MGECPLYNMEKILVFDLDNTVVDSRHRTPILNGGVDVEGFLKMQTRDNIYKDKLLPLSRLMKENFSSHHIVVCTARHMTHHDYDFLSDSGLCFHEIFERGNVDPKIASMPDAEYKLACLTPFMNQRFTFFDDNESVIQAFSRISNVTMIDSKIENNIEILAQDACR